MGRKASALPPVYDSNVSAFADEIDDGPMFLALLQMREVQISQFTPPQTTAEQNGEDRPIPFALESVVGWRLPKPPSLVSSKPISKPHTQLLHAFDASDARSKLRAQETGIGCFVGEPSYSGESSVDRSRRELPIFEENAVAGDHNLVERQSWLGAVPLNKFINGMSIATLGIG